ncbi:DUF6538 domain-containing protein [Pseudorhizobium endolithicum]|uniref:DUF6538 domain-containing protein n=1 Tax=Pseudorhizobium endolithicum TaxID=1191678 RepID=UPI0038B56FE5
MKENQGLKSSSATANCYSEGKDDVTSYPWLALRGRTYYLRAPVPADIVGSFGRREIWRSLSPRKSFEAAQCTYERRRGVLRARAKRAPFPNFLSAPEM